MKKTRRFFFWRKSSSSIKWKLITYDAIIRATLLYGIDSVQLIETRALKLDTFQLNVLRKNLKWETTFISRTNKHQQIDDKVQETLNQIRENEGMAQDISKT